GIRLIYRERSGVRMTAAGEVFTRRARAVLREAMLLLLDLEGFAEGIEGQIRVFANTTAASEFLPEVIQRLLHDRPNIAIDLRERLNPDIVRAGWRGRHRHHRGQGPVGRSRGASLRYRLPGGRLTT